MSKLTPSYLDQFATTWPGGSKLRYILRTLDDSEEYAKLYGQACEWYDMLELNIDDPFYINCSMSGCELHLDHTESMGYPCMIIVVLDAPYGREALAPVLEQVVQLKKYLFQNWMHKDDRDNMRISNSGLSIFCPRIQARSFRLVLHSRTLNTFQTVRLSRLSPLSLNAEQDQCRLKELLFDWRLLCDTHSLSDLANMPRWQEDNS